MNKYYILTLFPDMVMNGLKNSIIGRAIDNQIIGVEAVNIRDFTNDKHGHVDDYPYGGGAGMVMQAQPVYDAYQSVKEKAGKKPRVLYMTPQGKRFNQRMAEELSKEENLIFLCGHYEGIDERVLEMIVDDNVSLGDYVLTGGEMPAMVMIDSIARLIPGVLNNDESSSDESFSEDLLEYPQYTRPETFMDVKVPEVLLSGHHKNIEKWRRDESIKRTMERRPDLFRDKLEKDNQNEKLLNEVLKYNYGDAKRIQHLIKVYELASMIGKLEGLELCEQHILETASILHDIGIRICEKKYGKCDGMLQEKEGPAIAKKILNKLGYSTEVVDRVCYLVGHHHTYDGIQGNDYQILVEADFLVNIYEDDISMNGKKNAYMKIFKTETGKKLFKYMFGNIE